jgi:hypothetical protein
VTGLPIFTDLSVYSPRIFRIYSRLMLGILRISLPSPPNALSCWPGLPPDRSAVFELRFKTEQHPISRSRPMKCSSQGENGEPEESRQPRIEFLSNGSIVPLGAFHDAPIVITQKADGTFRIYQDFFGINAISQRSVDPLRHLDPACSLMRHARRTNPRLISIRIRAPGK